MIRLFFRSLFRHPIRTVLDVAWLGKEKAKDNFKDFLWYVFKLDRP